MQIDIEEENLFKESFGLWITCLFGNIPAFCHQDISFDEHKRIFFELLEKWLEGKRIAFRPVDCLYEGVWQESPRNISSWLQARWPISARHKDDTDLNYYFFVIPAILWVGPDGGLVGS